MLIVNGTVNKGILPFAAIMMLTVSICLVPGFGRATNDDLPVDIDETEYQAGLQTRTNNVATSLSELTAANSALATANAALLQAETGLQTALTGFDDVEFGGGRTALDTAWTSVSSALTALNSAQATYDEKLTAKQEAEATWRMNKIWLELFKNDYEAQTSTFAVRDGISRCSSVTCSATTFLRNERFTVFQPEVLEMVGAHHAYAKGLTGKGVRIGIQDDIVNYLLPEFEGRISHDEATLTYRVPFGDNFFSDASRCKRASVDLRETLGCSLTTYSDDTASSELQTLTARWVIANFGWPGEGEDWFILNEDLPTTGIFRILRWTRIPNATSSNTHGTNVASIAAGRDFGLAPGATVVPLAVDFSSAGQADQSAANSELLRLIAGLSGSEQEEWDNLLAESVTSDFGKFDVINRSYGIDAYDSASISAALEGDATLQGILPQTWRAYLQTETDPNDRTVIVYAAGNATEEFSGLGGDYPFYEPHVRGWQLSVMAVDHDGNHSEYTNFCGELPADWDSGRWGRHFCLAAPGTANAAGSGGQGYIVHQAEGTSFAAPVVTGAIALVMEHFRGQLGNTEIVKRVVNTADNDGRYAQLEIYGAGLLDLEAALNPVGTTVTGTETRNADVVATIIGVPPALGSLGRRLSSSGVEVASLDSMGAPFWSSPGRFVRSVRRTSAAIPVFATADQVEGGSAHLGFTPETIPVALNDNGLRVLLGEDRVGLELAPSQGLRWGALVDGASWQGGHASGAFGDRVRSATAWVGRNARLELGGDWSLSGSATLAVGQAALQPGSMLEVAPYTMSTWNVGLEHGKRGNGTWTGLSFSQPLRAETGKATLHYLSGLERGSPVYERAGASLAPEGRELELALTYETPIGFGRGVVELAHSWDAGHDPGRTHSRAGVAYRLTW